MSWHLYLIECADGSVYTGITTDVAARFEQHANGTGARYTRARKPLAVLASFPLPDRSSASRAEYWVKRLTPVQKRELAAGRRTLESVLPVVAVVALDADADAGEVVAQEDADTNAPPPRRARRKRADSKIEVEVTAAAKPKPEAKPKRTSKAAPAVQRDDARKPRDKAEAKTKKSRPAAPPAPIAPVRARKTKPRGLRGDTRGS
jgi:putative endonuclease